MGLMDRILTALPDSDWRQMAHERRSPAFDCDGDEYFRRSRERGAGAFHEPFEVPAAPVRPPSEFGSAPFEALRVFPESSRVRPSWHERLMPGDECAAQDNGLILEAHHTLEEPPHQEDFESCETCVPQDGYEPSARAPREAGSGLEPAAQASERVETGEEFYGAEALAASEAPYAPELYPLGEGMAIDADGFLTDAEGCYLKGLLLDPATGVRRGDVPSFVCVEHHFLPAKASREVRYQANLPLYPMTAASDLQLPGSELLDVQSFNRSPAANGFGVVAAEDAPKFLDQSLSGGSATLFDQTGSAVALRLRWAKIASSASGGADRWNLFYLARSDAVGRETAWRNAGLDYTFGPEGRLEPALPRVTLTGVMIDGARFGDVTLVHGRDGVTQFAGRHGVVKVRQLAQDGHVAGEFAGLDVSGEGLISARYTNGRTLPLAECAFACGDIPVTVDSETLRAAARLMGMVAYDEAA
jgi:hypothetical protein